MFPSCLTEMIVPSVSPNGMVIEMPDEVAEYLRVQEVARLLHVSPKTVARWADNGWLPCQVTLGGHRRFRRSDIEAVVRKMEERAAGH